MKKFLKILKNIWFIPVLIVLSPIIIVFVIVDRIKAFKPRKELKFLEEEGFKFSKQRKPYVLKWSFGNICIMIEDNKYKISFNYNTSLPDYVLMCDSRLGTEEERQKLRGVMLSYENAHPRDKMDGYPDINKPHVQFIKDNLYQIKIN